MGPKTNKSEKPSYGKSPNAASFFDVLESQIRKELREELEREAKTLRSEFDPNQARAGQFQTWMAAHTEKVVFTARSAKDVYGTPRPRPRTKTQPRMTRTLSVEEAIALELLNRYSGSALTESFSESDLKAAWRKAAFETHPDRAAADLQAQAASLFNEIGLAYTLLKAGLTPSTAAA